MAPLTADPIHDPLESSDVALPIEGRWEIREPGRDRVDAPPVSFGDPSWPGVRLLDDEALTFEPGVAPIDADSWDDDATAAGHSEHDAEALLARGQLTDALRMYQELATARPTESRLWARVAEIARMLQERSS